MEWADGRRDAVVFALEEESDWRRFSPRRLARYCLDIADMFDTDRVVPVTIFLRTADRAPASLVLGTERCPYLVFNYVACKLAEMPAESWLDSGEPGGAPKPAEHAQRRARPARRLPRRG